jgi:AraC-like DNA-binding protein
VNMSHPLERYTDIVSDNIEEVHQRTSAIFCSHRLSLLDDSQRLNARHSHASLGDVSLHYMQYGADVLIEPGRTERFYVFTLPLEGWASVECGDAEAQATPESAAFISPSEQVRIRWSANCRKLTLKIDRRFLQRHLERVVNRSIREPLVFERSLDLREGAGASALRALKYLIDDLENEGLFARGNSQTSNHFCDMIVSHLIEDAPNNYTEEIRSRSATVACAAVRRVERFIWAHAHESITLDHLVDASGVSTTALYEAFRHFRNTTPMAALRRLRMTKAREDLESGGLAGATVTEIAARWGFLQFGRFSSQYRERFGEFPSETIKRARLRQSLEWH